MGDAVAAIGQGWLPAAGAVFARLRVPFSNRRFRWLLLAVAGVPVAAMYLAVAVIAPLRSAGEPGGTDLAQVYYPASRIVLEGGDPYTVRCAGYGCDPLFSPLVSNRPPAMSWLLQPLAMLDFRTADVVAILACNLLLLAVIVLALAAARVRDRQAWVALALPVLAWGPSLNQVENRQPEMLVAGLSALWVLGYARGRRGLLGGAALGLATAIKLQTGPLALLVAGRRRWWMLAAAVLAAAAVTALATPGLLPEYVTRVLPTAASGSGYWFNVSLAGSVDRVLQPDSFWGRTYAVSPLVRPLSAAVVVLLAAITAWAAGRRAPDADGRLLEAAAGSSVALFAAPLVLPGHLVLLIPALLALAVLGARTRRWGLVAAAAGAWLLMGPGFQAAGYAIAVWPYAHWLIYPLGEVALAGQLLAWAAAVRELRRRRPGPLAP